MASKCIAVKLQSKDGDVFVVKAEVAKVSRTIATMLEGSIAYSKAADCMLLTVILNDALPHLTRSWLRSE